MSQRSVIRKGDRTSHGGVVVTGDETVVIFGQPMARVGDRVTCPLHNWVFDLNTGVAQGADEGAVPVWHVRVEGGRIFLDTACMKSTAWGGR